MAKEIEKMTSFAKLFPEIIYDESQISAPSLDIWNSYRLKVIPMQTNFDAYIKHRVVKQDTLESLARQYYSNAYLWWFVPLVNNAEDPFSFLDDVRNGENGFEDGKILILKAKYLADIFSSLKKNKNIENRNMKIN